MAGGIGTPLSPKVVQQLIKRQEAVSKTSGRTNQDLLYLTSKTGWVKLSSGVNTLTQAEIDQLNLQKGRLTIKGDSTTAKNNILVGGTIGTNGGLRQGIDTSGGYNESAAYNNRKNSTGIRPMPGITSMNVKSKNTLGTLREAEVKFTCWTLEDFELMEKVYLRPGFTMLLEWGHSMYIDNNGNLVKDIETIPDEFFNSGVSMASVLKGISNIRERSEYNYEGLVGYCRNFSWNYLPNGGYECTVNIISTGEILESLALRFDPQQRIDPADFEDSESETGKEERKSVFHFFISKMDQVKAATFGREELVEYTPDLTNKLQPFTAYYYAVEITRWFWDKNQPLTWFPLRTFLDVYNNAVSLLDGTKTADSPDRAYAKFNINYAKSSKFLTSEEHFSVDPIVCILHNKDSNGYGVVQPIHNNLATLPEGSTYDDVLNIYVTTGYIKSKLDEALDADGKLGKSMSDIVESILEGINTALGGINDLGLAYDEEDEGGTWYITDRNNTPADTISQMPTLALAGINSIFTDVGISSKISNEIGSQIAVAAQGSIQSFSENVENILKWNPGVIDRLRTTKDVSDKNKEGIQAVEDDRAKREAEWIDTLKTFFEDFSTSGYEEDDMQTAKTMHAEWTVANVVKKGRTRKSKPLPGIVPVELSFKLDGIGGFKIGESFKIASGILPSKYQDRFGYLITGLEHNIGTNQKWETSITTQFFPIESPTAQEVQSAGTAGTGGSGGGGGNSGGSGGGGPVLSAGKVTGTIRPISQMKPFTQQVLRDHQGLVLVREGTDGKIGTVGAMYYKQKLLAATIEDPVRAVKVTRQTCIPDTVSQGKVPYNLNLTPSSKETINNSGVDFGDKRGRVAPRVGTTKDAVFLNSKSGKLNFSGIFIHAGATRNSSEGCIIVSNKRLPDGNVVKEFQTSRYITTLIKNDKIKTIYVVNDW